MHCLKPLFLAAVACFTLAAGFAGAAEAPNQDGPAKARPRPDMTRMFQAADANGDQKVTFSEIRAKMPNFPEDRFKSLDANQDGVLEVGELPKPANNEGAPGEAMRKRMQQADSDKNGRVSASEFAQAFPQAPAARFSGMDKNGDGFLDRTDFSASPGDRANAAQKGAGKAGNKSAESRAAGARQEIAGYSQKLLARHDADGNGSLTLEELQASKRGFPSESFSAIDRNKDGVISAADFGQ